MTLQQQQYYYYMQRQRQSMLNAYARQMMMATQRVGGVADVKLPNDKLRLVVETTDQYKKTGIYSAERDDAEKPVVIDWGDGTVEEIDGDVSQKVHEYASVGQFNVVVENIKSYAASASNNTWREINKFTLKKIITLPETITSIEKYAFCFCENLEYAELHDKITIIDEFGFWCCYKLANINSIPDGVTRIGQRAFCGCYKFTSMKFGKNVKKLGIESFMSCSSLTSVVIPSNVEEINTRAFQYCKNLTDLTLDSKEIGYQAFIECSSLKNVKIGNNVTKIGARSFEKCSSLASIKIPDNIESIGGSAFNNCNEALYDTTTMVGLTLVDGWVISYTNELTENLDLTGVRGICDNTFQNCSTITNVIIPDNIGLGYSTFNNCTNLSSITIGSNVKITGSNVFSGSKNLSRITCKSIVAPETQTGIFGSNNNSYTGRNTYDQGINKLYVPTGATGYDSSYWADPLQNPNKCGFTIEYI